MTLRLGMADKTATDGLCQDVQGGVMGGLLTLLSVKHTWSAALGPEWDSQG